MKLPSLSFLTEQSVRTFKRFPFTLLNALAGTIAAIIILDHDGINHDLFLSRIGITSVLGISFLTTIVLIGEKRNWPAPAIVLSQIAGILLLAGYYVTLPANLETAPQAYWIRFAMLLTGLHLLVAAAPFAGKGDVNGFWQYNKTLFIRILTAVLFSSVLFAGLAIALQAVEHLFGIDINNKRYPELYVVIMGIFNTWFFLGGVPDIHTIEKETDYPKVLKIFTQYILIPLVIVYVLILYTYTGKIIATWEWPEGWVSKLILGFSITGVLSLLLVHPVKDILENKWIRTVTKWFYILLIPLDAMLLLAIGLRISDYGITEARYVVLVLGLWLTAITLYFVLSKSKNIKMIPSSLCIVAFLASFGPWGAMHISEKSQIARLESFLTKNQILDGGKITKDHPQVTFEDSKEISSIVRYLNDVHGYAGIQQWFDVNLDTVGKNGVDTITYAYRYQSPPLITQLMGVKYIDQWHTEENSFHHFTSVRSGVIDLNGYSFIIPFENFGLPESTRTVKAGTAEYNLRFNHKQLLVSVSTGQEADSIAFELIPLIDALVEKYGTYSYQSTIPSDSMTVTLVHENIRGKMILRNIQCQKSDQQTSAQYISGELFIGYRSEEQLPEE